MRLLTLFVILPALAAVGTAQSTAFATGSQMGVFAQMDSQTPKYSTHPGGAAITVTDARKVRADGIANNTTVAHTRATATLRMLGRFPAVRIYEVGLISTLPRARQRAIGSSAKPGTAGKTIEPHTFMLRFAGTPGERVRVHTRLASAFAGKNTSSPTPTNITGLAKVDVNNDRSYEFDKTLDGVRYLGNHTATVGTSGVLEIKIEVGALITSTAAVAASYSMVFDVYCEPVRGIVSSLEPYGPQCGPDVYGVTWVVGDKRHIRTVLEGAAASSPALLVVGVSRFRLPIPGMTCDLLTSPLAMLQAVTNAAGRIINDFPTFPATLAVDVNFQYGVITSNRAHLSKGLGFRVFRDSPRAYDHFDVNHILSTGQSLALGGLGRPVLSTRQNFKNVMFSNGLSGLSLNVVPLVEQTWETMSSGMTSTASYFYKNPYNNPGSAPNNTHDILVSLHAAAGLPYINLKKGTPPFSTGISQFRIAKFVADSKSQSYVVRCVTNVHGETDHTLYNSDYAKNLIEWQRDYEEGIQSRGQTEPVPMLHSQMSSFTSYGAKNSIIPGLQLEASLANPRDLPLVCPKYFLSYVDGVHLTNKSYRHMGEYYGKVYNQVIVEGAAWEPLRPLSAKRNGAQIKVRFHVPVPPLVIDTTLVRDPGNYGFEYNDDSGNPPTIKSVYLFDEDTVLIILSTAPKAGARKTLGYAHTGTPGARAGPQTGARGNLRDTDRTPSLFGNRLYNWAVHFVLPLQ